LKLFSNDEDLKLEIIQKKCDNLELKKENNYIVYFLNDDEEQSVIVDESKEVNFSQIIQQLNHGGSIFITHRRKPKPRTRNQKNNS
jgi:hypothetical protein